ncbi:MAG: ABC transporter permease [Bacteroidota bacterium]|nr:ABC transporter permease [Bacteroidota bacterium]
MSGQIQALKAELIKNKYSNVIWVTFIAFLMAPIMGGVFMLIMRNPEAMAKAGGLSAKAQVMNLSANWNSYFGILTQAIGVGGVLVFGFVASWIFGREYSDGTAKDLLSLPTSRTNILNAKFIVYIIWCFALTISNLLIGLLIGTILQLSSMEMSLVTGHVTNYIATTVMTILIGTPIAFFAIWGKGYLAPLGFVALTLVFAQIIAATGYGYYFPWSVPGLFSGAGGEYKAQLNLVSYIILILTSVAGYLATVTFWKYADQTK